MAAAIGIALPDHGWGCILVKTPENICVLILQLINMRKPTDYVVCQFVQVSHRFVGEVGIQNLALAPFGIILWVHMDYRYLWSKLWLNLQLPGPRRTKPYAPGEKKVKRQPTNWEVFRQRKLAETRGVQEKEDPDLYNFDGITCDDEVKHNWLLK